MDHFGKNIHKLLILTLLCIVSPCVSSAQNQIDTDALKVPVQSILEKYVYLSGEIRPDIQPDPARPFIQLFYNPEVRVLDDLEANPTEDQIRIHYYGEKIKRAFPDGLTTIIDLDNFRIVKIPEDPENRMVIEVKVRKTVTGLLDGQTYQQSNRVKFLIGFDLEEGEYRNFLIHGIAPLVEHDHDLILYCSPSQNRLVNSKLADDSRFTIPWSRSWKAGLHYQYHFSSYWGIRAGLDAALNRQGLLLDKFDPLGDRDPNLRDIEWSVDLYHVELPVNIVFRLQPVKRLSIMALAGFTGGYLIFADIRTTAENSHSGKRMDGVMSDPEVYNNISSFDLIASGGIEIGFDITKRISFILQAGYRHGLINQAGVEETDSPYGKYQGQYNPLFSNPGSRTYSQSYHGTIGLTYRILGSKLL